MLLFYFVDETDNLCSKSFRKQRRGLGSSLIVSERNSTYMHDRKNRVTQWDKSKVDDWNQEGHKHTKNDISRLCYLLYNTC